MPFQKHARITVTNEGKEKVDAFYFNIDLPRLRETARCGHTSISTHSTPAISRKGLGSRLDVQWRTKVNGQEESRLAKTTTSGSRQPAAATTSASLCPFWQNQNDWWGEGR